MITNYIKVGLMAYLFLCTSVPGLLAQYKPAWEYPSYMDIHRLHLNPATEAATPEGSYIKSLKIALSNLMRDTPATVEVVAQLEALSLVIEKADIPEQYKQYYLNDISMLSALMELKAGSEVKFMWMMNQLYRKSTVLAQDYPDFVPAKKLNAMMQIMVGSVPDQYQWIFRLLGFEGDLINGLQQLENLGKHRSNLKHEGIALYYLVKNYLQPEFSGKDIEQIDRVLKKNKDLHLLRFVAGLSYIKQHQSLKAREVFQKVENIVSFPILNYFIAETYLHESKLQTAISYYQIFLEKSQGENLVKDAYFKIYLCHYLNNSSEADKFYKLALNEGDTKSEGDKNADRLLRTSPLPDPIIFRLRFFTDGGFFEEAHELINTAETNKFSETDKTEWTYRKARLFHLDGQTAEAIPLYKKVILLPDERYFAPNSCLQLGILYMEKNDKVQAQAYFEKALDFKNYTYENSIRSKVRSALKNLNKD